jgi:hypothetical protein
MLGELDTVFFMNGYLVAYAVSLGLGMLLCLVLARSLLIENKPEPVFSLRAPDQLDYSRFGLLKTERATYQGKPARLVTVAERQSDEQGRIVIELTQVWSGEEKPAKAVAPPWEVVSVSREGFSGTYEFFFSHGTLQKLCRNGVTIPAISPKAREMAGRALQATRYLAHNG